MKIEIMVVFFNINTYDFIIKDVYVPVYLCLYLYIYVSTI